jgi:hypothetical protein
MGVSQAMDTAMDKHSVNTNDDFLFMDGLLIPQARFRNEFGNLSS